MSNLESKFHKDMLNIYLVAKRDIGYNANRFLEMISKQGGLRAAKTLISKEDGTYGFTALWESGRLDLSVEAHVLKPEHSELFTDEERRICRERLEKYSWK